MATTLLVYHGGVLVAEYLMKECGGVHGSSSISSVQVQRKLAALSWPRPNLTVPTPSSGTWPDPPRPDAAFLHVYYLHVLILWRRYPEIMLPWSSVYIATATPTLSLATPLRHLSSCVDGSGIVIAFHNWLRRLHYNAGVSINHRSMKSEKPQHWNAGKRNVYITRSKPSSVDYRTWRTQAQWWCAGSVSGG